MKTRTVNGSGAYRAESRTTVHRAINWLETYISKNPHTDAAIEARNIIRDLEAIRTRPAVDELLALLGQIAKSAGLQEIERAKIRMSQPAETMLGEVSDQTRPISDVGESVRT